jgi:hypothetical protein
MKKIEIGLISLFALKCLASFIMKDYTIADGLFLVLTVTYLFIKMDLSLPADENE